MTSNQFRAALKKVGFSQRGFARLIGAAERTSRRWALDEAEVPIAIAILLRLMMAGKVTALEIEAARK